MWPFAWRSHRSKPMHRSQIAELNASQGKVSGFDLRKSQSTKVLIVGAGALGSSAGHMLARKGIGSITILDDDRVEAQNLTRQLYGRADIGRNKAFALAANVCREALFPLHAVGYRLRLQEVIERRPQLLDECDPWLVLVDNDQARHDACIEGLRRGKSVITAGLARDASSLYVAVQEPNNACLACIRPQLAKPDGEYPCNLPGIIDVSMLAASLVVFAVDSVIGDRHRSWNYRSIVLDGSMPDRCERITRNPQCGLCGHLQLVEPNQLTLPLKEAV